jgi:hypothetical protein
MKLLPPFAELGEATPAQPPPVDGPEAETPLDLLRSIWRDRELPLSTRMRAAIAAAPYVHPKLSVSASFSGKGIADAIERAHAQRFAPQTAKVIEHERAKSSE